MDSEVWKTLVGSGGVSVVVAAMFTGAWRVWQNRRTGLRAEDMDDAEWNAAFKAGAERHVLGYDVPMRQALIEVQQILRQSGLDDPKVEVPDPRDFPLFPTRGDKEKP